MRVEIDSRWPVSLTVDVRDFGRLFAEMNCRDQVEVFRSMIEEMEAHPLQWDYIAIDLEADENQDLRRKMGSIVQTLIGGE